MLKSLALRAHGKGLELACRIRPDVPDALLGDPSRLGQIITNLVGNAIKFTEQGEVVLEVKCDSQTADEVVLHFTVSDTGIGIPADKLRHDLRGVHAGRRIDHSPPRWNRSGPDHLLAAGRSDGRPDLGRKPAGPRQRRSTSRSPARLSSGAPAESEPSTRLRCRHSGTDCR